MIELFDFDHFLLTFNILFHLKFKKNIKKRWHLSVCLHKTQKFCLSDKTFAHSLSIFPHSLIIETLE